MARARNIKPAFFTNDELSELSPLDRLAFIGMWTVADYRGCIEFKPKRLKVQILPYDDCDLEIIANNLDKSGFVRIYSVKGQRYIKILNFEKHQNPHKNEREAGSTIPDITESENKINKLDKDGTEPENIETNPADSLLLIPDSLNIDSLKDMRADALDDGFDEFWNYYPKKVGKDKAKTEWNKKKPKIDDVLNALKWQKDSEQWDKGFIPNPATYLSQGRWKDEPTMTGVPF
jgi:hypothetical protein